MSSVNGQLVTCERCGKTVFRKCIGEGETDGGFTRWNKFEELAQGWDLVAVPKLVRCARPGNAYHNYIQVCPACHELWDQAVIDGFLKGTPYYEEGNNG